MSEPYWVALAGGGVDYKGDWASATDYKSGDVVRRNGVEYLAVNPSTGAIPPLAPSAAGVELAYAENPASTSVAATTEATAVSIVTAPAITVDGATSILVEFFCIACQAGTTSLTLFLFDGSTSLGAIHSQTPSTTYQSARAARRLTPAAGSHTYSIRAVVNGGTGTVFSGAGGTGANAPAFIRISTSQPIRMGVAIPPTYGTSLPSSPLDGQEAVLVDSLTNPSYQWRFRYNAGSASAYKWEFVGGASAAHEVSASETTGSTTYVDLTGPTLTVPRAGLYLVHADLQNHGNGSATTGATVGVKLGSAVMSSTEEMIGSRGNGGLETSIGITFTAVLAASDVVKLQYKVVANVGAFWNRCLTITPVKVA